MINILIADDYPVVRAGLKQILQETTDIRIMAEADHAQAVLDEAANHPIHVVLLDLSMPGRSGMDVLQDLKRLFPDIRVLVLSIYPEDQYAVRVLKAGADGYMNKDSVPDELINAVRKVSVGGRYVSPSLAEKLASDLQESRHGDLHEKLSNREYQVLCWMASGKTVKEIADELHLSLKTISTYRARILEKMHLRNNAELIHYAVTKRLVI